MTFGGLGRSVKFLTRLYFPHVCNDHSKLLVELKGWASSCGLSLHSGQLFLIVSFIFWTYRIVLVDLGIFSAGSIGRGLRSKSIVGL